jgi:hypothetical protein
MRPLAVRRHTARRHIACRTVRRCAVRRRASLCHTDPRAVHQCASPRHTRPRCARPRHVRPHRTSPHHGPRAVHTRATPHRPATHDLTFLTGRLVLTGGASEVDLSGDLVLARQLQQQEQEAALDTRFEADTLAAIEQSLHFGRDGEQAVGMVDVVRQLEEADRVEEAEAAHKSARTAVREARRRPIASPTAPAPIATPIAASTGTPIAAAPDVTSITASAATLSDELAAFAASLDDLSYFATAAAVVTDAASPALASAAAAGAASPALATAAAAAAELAAFADGLDDVIPSPAAPTIPLDAAVATPCAAPPPQSMPAAVATPCAGPPPPSMPAAVATPCTGPPPPSMPAAVATPCAGRPPSMPAAVATPCTAPPPPSMPAAVATPCAAPPPPSMPAAVATLCTTPPLPLIPITSCAPMPLSMPVVMGLVPVADHALALEASESRHRTEIENIESRHQIVIDQLCGDIAEQRELNYNLQDQLQWYADSRNDSELKRQRDESDSRLVELRKDKTLQAQMMRSKEVAELKLENKRLQKVADQLEEAERRLQEYASKGVVGERLTAKGNELREQLSTEAGAREVAQSGWETAEKRLERGRRVDQLVAHLEAELFSAGAGDVDRTHLLTCALLDRPAVKAVLRDHGPVSQKVMHVASAMLKRARTVLKDLSADDSKGGHRGTRTTENHLKFETILFSLIPDDASEEGMLRTIGDLLDVHWEQLNRNRKRQQCCVQNDSKDAITRTFCMKRKRRCDYRDAGRALCSNFWHARTRLDTNVGHKKRQRTTTDDGWIDYIEHWRHEQFDTNEQMAEQFFESCEYEAYRTAGGPAFGKDIFYAQKCFCIEQSKFNECACPPCMLARETLRDWDRQRAQWYREAEKEGGAPCTCANKCQKGGAYRQASRSLSALKAYVHSPCGKKSFSQLQIESGPKVDRSIDFYQRQCCQVPLPDGACPHRQPDSKVPPQEATTCEICSNCDSCGWDAVMHECPIEIMIKRMRPTRCSCRVLRLMGAPFKMSCALSNAHGRS